MQILNQTKSQIKQAQILTIKIEPPIPFIHDGIFIGIDPGTTNLGIAKLIGYPNNPSCYVYQISMIRDANPIERIKHVQQIINMLLVDYVQPMKLIIEGASFGDKFRQVELAEQRAAIVSIALTKGIPVTMAPPLTIRKVIFGSGKKKADMVWPEIPKDAAAALSCAYYAMMSLK